MKFEWPMFLSAMRLLLSLLEPTPVGDGFQGVFHARRPQGGLLQKIHPLPVAQDFNGPNQSGGRTRRYKASAVVFLTSSITA